MKKKIGILIAVLLYVVLAAAIAFAVYLDGNYPAGTDTMCHVYKGNVLYHCILEGNWYPLYDNFWYNGVQMMRYWAPLPVYFLAFCQALAGGNDIAGYLVFVALVFFFGAVVWLYIGVKKERVLLGAFLGVIWFFMPNNLFALFVEGNLPRSLSMVLLPLLMYDVYEFLFEDKWREIKKVIPVFTGIALCHVGYAGMIALAMLIFLLVYRIVYQKKGKCMAVIYSLVLPFLLIGVWMYASLKGGITSTDSSQVMKGFFQDAVISLNPIRRITLGNSDFYFGAAAFFLAVFGAVCSKKKSMVGFWSAFLIFICTTTSMYPVLKKLPGSQYLWMLRFISIALCMILYSFLIWKTLRKGLVIFCCILLLADVIPSLALVYSGKGEMNAQERMVETAEATLISKARDITRQRVALMDESLLGAMAQYLLTDYNGQQIQETFGAGWQSAATASNIVQLNESLANGYYAYLFDRALELGNDSVLIKISQLKEQEKDIEAVTADAEKLGYQLVERNSGYLLYHIDTYNTFGTICQYNGLGIGTSASLLAYSNPDLEVGRSVDLGDYTFEELSGYQMIYLAGFTYDDKKQAEELVIRLSEAGVKVIITGDGIPANERTKNQEFLGVTCQSIVFENGYPILYTDEGELDCYLFDRDYSDWQTVYFNGLEKSEGYLYDSGRKVDFVGTVKNDNIYFIGLNLPYHYFLTHDEGAGELINHMIGSSLNELPDRQIVPLEVEYSPDRIVITSPENQVNTSLAYHDIFHSNQKLVSENHLTYVNKGKTVITMKYPYLTEGFVMSIAGVILSVLYILWVRKRYSGERRTGYEQG